MEYWVIEPFDNPTQDYCAIGPFETRAQAEIVAESRTVKLEMQGLENPNVFVVKRD